MQNASQICVLQIGWHPLEKLFCLQGSNWHRETKSLVRWVFNYRDRSYCLEQKSERLILHKRGFDLCLMWEQQALSFTRHSSAAWAVVNAWHAQAAVLFWHPVVHLFRELMHSARFERFLKFWTDFQVARKRWCQSMDCRSCECLPSPKEFHPSSRSSVHQPMIVTAPIKQQCFPTVPKEALLTVSFTKENDVT